MAAGGGGTGAIYQFFKKLTKGEFKNDENPYQPFSLFISGYRRTKILDAMMNKDDKKKKEGELILNNYKKQLAERMAREKADRGETISNKSSRRGMNDDDDTISNKVGEFGQNEPMEPEILLQILNKKGKK